MKNNQIIYTCKYTPLEIFHGFGTECIPADPEPQSFDCADACAHPNLCGYGKGLIEEVRSRRPEALLLTDCCDVMRRVYDVLKRNEEIPFLYFLPLPRRTGDAAGRLFASSLKEMAQSWEKYSGIPFQWERAAQAWRTNVQEAGECAKKLRGVRHVSLRGAHAGSLLYDFASQRIALPVTDDTCQGNRWMNHPDDELTEDNFFYLYAKALLGQHNPCMRMQGTQRAPVNANTVGIIYHTVKFCDYYGFEYHDLKGSVAVPLLKTETDLTPQSSGQLRTRLDAFAETLDAVPDREDEKHMGAGVKKTKRPEDVRFAAGLDSGSTSTDAAILDREGHILGTAIVPTGAGAAAGAAQALSLALERAGLKEEELDAVVTTGYGRENVGLDGRSITEITCHARGAHFLCPSARTVIDIGGQDSKVIRLDENGNVENFAMNDKCAAGTGRFLEMMASTLGMSLGEMSSAGLQWKKEVRISSMCTVFAESEVVSLVAANTPVPDIIRGLNVAVASKTASLCARVNGKSAVSSFCMTGGVSQNAGIVKALEEKLQAKVQVPEYAQLCGAIGAALFGLEG